MKEYPEIDLFDFITFLKSKWKLLIVIIILSIPAVVIYKLNQNGNYCVETAYFFPVKHYGYERQQITKEFVLEFIDNQNFYSKILNSNHEINLQEFYPEYSREEALKQLKKQIEYEFSPTNFFILTVNSNNETLSKLLAIAFISTLNNELNDFVLNANKSDINLLEKQLIHYDIITDSLSSKLYYLEKELEKNPKIIQYQIFSLSEELNRINTLSKTIELEKSKLTNNDFKLIEIEQPYYIRNNDLTSTIKLFLTAAISSFLGFLSITLLLYAYKSYQKNNND